ncbi:hypothetical protein FACS1894124_0830 [Spirochaetia bacterium]|nr:hypothetical protein FACS1894124_0830 [Spirochaetia bacterium]
MKVTKEMRARVFAVGNKIAAESGTRTGAFKAAWQLVRDGLEVKVAGTSFGRRPVALARLSRYHQDAIRAVAVAEPGNTYDPHAVAILVGVNGGKGLYKIGYCPASIAPVVAALHTLPSAAVVGDTVRGLRLRFQA